MKRRDEMSKLEDVLMELGMEASELVVSGGVKRTKSSVIRMVAKDGMTASEVLEECRAMGVEITMQMVYSALKGTDVELGKKERENKYGEKLGGFTIGEAMVKLYDSGLSVGDVAKVLSVRLKKEVRYQHVYNVLKNKGLK